MSTSAPIVVDRIHDRDLDESYYGLSAAESAFFKAQTGIADDEELKRHIVAVQNKAYAVFPYRCILRFTFTKLKISRLPGYQQFLALGREREGAIFLDIGCCFGNDVRKAVADGYPIQNVIASDLRGDFWTLGHELFKSTPATFPAPFIAGDAFDPAHLAPAAPFTAASPPSTSAPALATLTSLTPLHGHVSAIHASSFFHLFDEPTQLTLARALAPLLRPAPGSMLFGSHGGMRAPATWRAGDTLRFCHSPESWRALWEGIFGAGNVRVEAGLVDSDRPKPEDDRKEWRLMWWTVTRL